MPMHMSIHVSTHVSAHMPVHMPIHMCAHRHGLGTDELRLGSADAYLIGRELATSMSPLVLERLLLRGNDLGTATHARTHAPMHARACMYAFIWHAACHVGMIVVVPVVATCCCNRGRWLVGSMLYTAPLTVSSLYIHCTVTV